MSVGLKEDKKVLIPVEVFKKIMEILSILEDEDDDVFALLRQIERCAKLSRK
jgi:hypothetical protein